MRVIYALINSLASRLRSTSTNDSQDTSAPRTASVIRGHLPSSSISKKHGANLQLLGNLSLIISICLQKQAFPCIICPSEVHE